MRAALYEEIGPASDVLHVRDIEAPTPAPGEVLVRLRTSGVNPADAKRRSGWGGLTLDLPFRVPHDDGAGTVEAIGDDVRDIAVGDRVWLYTIGRGRQFGTAAEYIAVPAHGVVPLPDGVDFATGACLGSPARTAHRCLFSDGPIEGANVLVAGAAGAVGHSAVQQARAAGAHIVIGTVGREEHEQVARDAGCDAVLDYRAEDLVESVMDTTRGRGVDRIVEVDLAANMQLDCRVAATNGTISFYGTDSDHKPVVPLWRLLENSVLLRSILMYNTSQDEHALAVKDINAWLTSGHLTPRVAQRFSLDEIALAHDAVEFRSGDANVVVEID